MNYLVSINKMQRLRGEKKGSAPSCLEVYSFYLAKEKAILIALNMLKSRSRMDVTYTGFIWAPKEKESQITSILEKFPIVEIN